MTAKRESSSAPFLVILAIRALGVVVLLIGLATAVKVLERSWGLLGDHRTVVELSEAIDKQSGLNAFLGKGASRLGGLIGAGQEVAVRSSEDIGQQVSGEVVRPVPAASAAPSLKASYFMAWPLATMVLFLIARIALSLIMTGANLALRAASGDDQIRILVNELVHEIRAGRDEPIRRQ